MGRPPVTIVVPFAGSGAELDVVVRRFAAVKRGDGDEVIVVQNSPSGPGAGAADDVRIVPAPEVASSYYARNRGAELAQGEWILFCDADTEPDAGLVDSYFEPVPDERTGILAGAVHDHVAGDSLAARLARETAAMSQRTTLDNPFMPYAITANCAIRAAAFRQAGGFEASIRSGGDADLCWRLQRLGWGIEERPGAAVQHQNRPTMRAVWRQRLRHGAGAGWLESRYPGAMPRWGLAALVRDSSRRLAGAARSGIAGRREAAALEAAEVSGWWAFELGRRLPNRAARRR